VDEHGIVRWLQRSARGEAALELLHAALEHARQRLQRQQRLASGARAPTFSRPQLTTALLEAMAATFGAGEARTSTPEDLARLPPGGFRPLR
jgi:hypothetical protein